MNAMKILFTDLDGTLLNDERKISIGNRQAIKKALEHSHKIVITTGRPLPSAMQLVEELGLTHEGCYAITYNGGLIYDCHSKEAVFQTTLPLEQVSYIFDVARKHHVHCNTYTDTHVISEKKTIELVKYCSRIKVPYELVENINTYLTKEPVKVVMLDLAGRDRLARIQVEMSTWCTGTVNCYFSSAHILEFGPLQATKGSALKYLCNFLNIPIEDSVAAGDEENDISMLHAAGIGVAMANASNEIKEHSNYVTRNNNNNDGIAEIIQKFIL